MDQPDQPFLLADLWLIHYVRSAKLDQLFHIVLDQLSRSAQLSRLNIPLNLQKVLLAVHSNP